VQDLQAVSAAVAEREQGSADPLEIKLLFNDGGQSIVGFSHVRDAAHDVDLNSSI